MLNPLLTTKLYIPPSRPNLIPRSHLIERLNAALFHEFTLISAPAGFGKTTLVSSWLDALQAGNAFPTPNQIAWLSLDENDGAPAQP